MAEQGGRAEWKGLEGGLLNVDKPAGVTSRDVVDLVARPLKRARIKVGHAGTLDPLATGVLVLCLGQATRLIEFIQGQAKTYVARIRLGATSDTLDAEGTIEERGWSEIPSEGEVRRALALQLGEIEQRPPAYSALKIGGRRSYELAREGRGVEPEARRVRIDRLEVLRYEWPIVEIEVQCGGGTYIRSIARDLGEELGCGGLIEALRRTRIGPFSVERAIPADERLGDPERVREALLPMALALEGSRLVRLSRSQVSAIRQGQKIRHEEAALLAAGEVVGLTDLDGGLVAVGTAEAEGGWIQPKRVLGEVSALVIGGRENAGNEGN